MTQPSSSIAMLVAGISLAVTFCAQAATTAAAPAASGARATAVPAAGTAHGTTVTEKLAACNAKAKEQHLKRKAKRAFMSDCAKA